jgi:hypothetical protein
VLRPHPLVPIREETKNVDLDNQCYDEYVDVVLAHQVKFIMTTTRRAFKNESDLVVWCFQEASVHFWLHLEKVALQQKLQLRIYNQNQDDRDSCTVVFGPLLGCEGMQTLRLGGEPAVPPTLMLTINLEALQISIVNVHRYVPRAGDEAKRYNIVHDVVQALSATPQEERRRVVVVAGDFNMKPQDFWWQNWESLSGASLIWHSHIHTTDNKALWEFSPNDHIFALSLDGADKDSFDLADLTDVAFRTFSKQSKKAHGPIMAALKTIPKCLHAVKLLSKKFSLDPSMLGEVGLSDHAPIGFGIALKPS